MFHLINTKMKTNTRRSQRRQDIIQSEWQTDRQTYRQSITHANKQADIINRESIRHANKREAGRTGKQTGRQRDRRPKSAALQCKSR